MLPTRARTAFTAGVIGVPSQDAITMIITSRIVFAHRSESSASHRFASQSLWLLQKAFRPDPIGADADCPLALLPCHAARISSFCSCLPGGSSGACPQPLAVDGGWLVQGGLRPLPQAFYIASCSQGARIAARDVQHMCTVWFQRQLGNHGLDIHTCCRTFPCGFGAVGA